LTAAETFVAGRDAEAGARRPRSQPDIAALHHDPFRRRGGIASFTFEIGGAEAGGDPLSRAKRSEFAADFDGELERLERWSADRHWLSCVCPDLQVFVSDRYRISKALVPAWYGRNGHMEFPAWRVAARQAAIVHELVHVFFPNGNRLLAEGLAVYLQAAIGGNPAFPNFGRSLHGLVRENLSEMVPAFVPGEPNSLCALRLAELDLIATPSPLVLRVGNDAYGEEPRGQARIYPIAGSFVQFLIEQHGMEKFRTLYMRTPLTPLASNGGSPDRWNDAYGLALADLEAEWQVLMAAGGAGQHAAPSGDGSDDGFVPVTLNQ
jgi:hypothetical protein